MLNITTETETTSKFEDDYRIVKQKSEKEKILYVGMIEDYFSAIPILSELNVAKEDETLYLSINSDGGELYTALSIVMAIKRTKAKVIALCDVAASAATIITLACDEVWVTPLTEFMVHSVTSGSYGNTKDNKILAQHQEKYFTDIMIDCYKGFLTKEEVKTIVDNGDTLWMYGDLLIAKLNTWAKQNSKKVKVY